MEKVFFEKINGKKIFCCLSQPQSPSKKLVIMCHGFRGNSVGASRTFVNFKKLLVSEGFFVLRFDQPNSGNSEGAFIDSSFNDWVKTIEYLAMKYLDEGYEIVMLGHSMGATAVGIAMSELKDKIPAIMLWAPDPKTDTTEWLRSPATQHQDNIIEEGGQQYKASFWQEVQDADFFRSVDQYKGGIHLIYGEKDIFVSKELRNKVISAVENNGNQSMILKGQGHLGWDYDVCEKVFKTELEFIKDYLS